LLSALTEIYIQQRNGLFLSKSAHLGLSWL
jgi:hypothetical protein